MFIPFSKNYPVKTQNNNQCTWRTQVRRPLGMIELRWQWSCVRICRNRILLSAFLCRKREQCLHSFSTPTNHIYQLNVNLKPLCLYSSTNCTLRTNVCHEKLYESKYYPSKKKYGERKTKFYCNLLPPFRLPREAEAYCLGRAR